MEEKITINTPKGPKKISKGHHLKSLIKIIEAISVGVQNHYQKLGLQYVEVPEIVGITGACENVDTLFKVGNRLDLPLFITQTGQLGLEQALQYYPGVYTIIHSGRDEEVEDKRHLRQFRLTEEEFDWTMVDKNKKYDEEVIYQALLNHIELATKAMIRNALKNCIHDLKKIYQCDIQALRKLLNKSFLRITYEEAITLLNKNGFPGLSWGSDLKSEHEQLIIDLLNKRKKKAWEKRPVFIMRYPKKIKFFNMKVSEKDRRVVLSADLIFPLSGEAVGAAVREYNGKKLKKRLLESTMFKLHQQRGGSYQDFVWYIEEIIGAGKTKLHAGYGIGNERIIQYLLGQEDIRLCSLFSLTDKQIGDWDRKRRGTIHFISRKKTILLSIGGIANKRKLLNYIKKISDGSFTFYATQNTHQFLKKDSIETTLVYKISQAGKMPNLTGLLKEKLFDIIINIPTRRKKERKEYTDGQMIRKKAIETGTTLITDVEVAKDLIENLYKTVIQEKDKE